MTDIVFSKEMLLNAPQTMDNTVVFDQVFCEVTETNHSNTSLPLEMVLALLDEEPKDGKRLPVFQDIASIVTPEAVDDNLSLHDPEPQDCAEETFSMVSELSFDQSFIYDGENNDESSVDQLLDGLGEEDDDGIDDENEANEESSEWSFDLSCLIDNDEAKSTGQDIPSIVSEGERSQQEEVGSFDAPAADDSSCAMDLDDMETVALHAAEDFFMVDAPSSSCPHFEACHLNAPTDETLHPVAFPEIAGVSQEFFACLDEQQCIRQSVR